jgi:hypothetical protein
MPRGVNGYDTAKLQGRNVGSANALSIVSPEIITNGIITHLDAGNKFSYPGSGTTWFDLTTNRNNHTLNGGVSAGPDHLIFNGSSGYTQGASGLRVGTGVNFSLELWVNFSVITSARWWLAVIGQYSPGSIHWIGSSPTSTQFGVFGGNQNSPNLRGANQWIQIVATNGSNSMTNYVNGYASGGAAFSSSAINFTDTILYLGLRIASELYFNGKISIVRVYNRALSPTEVEQNFNANRARFGI